MLADKSQCQRTKLQWQKLKELESAGVAVRLCSGTSVRSAYSDDGRAVRVGAGLKGIHHAKSVLFVHADGSARLIAGSLNFTTSSKANQEVGLSVRLPAGSNAAGTWLDAFNTAWSAGQKLEEVADQAPAASSSANRP